MLQKKFRGSVLPEIGEKVNIVFMNVTKLFSPDARFSLAPNSFSTMLRPKPCWELRVLPRPLAGKREGEGEREGEEKGERGGEKRREGDRKDKG